MCCTSVDKSSTAHALTITLGGESSIAATNRIDGNPGESYDICDNHLRPSQPGERNMKYPLRPDLTICFRITPNGFAFVMYIVGARLRAQFMLGRSGDVLQRPVRASGGAGGRCDLPGEQRWSGSVARQFTRRVAPVVLLIADGIDHVIIIVIVVVVLDKANHLVPIAGGEPLVISGRMENVAGEGGQGIVRPAVEGDRPTDGT